MGANHTVSINYSLTLGTPKEYYHQVHRPTHFLQFSKMEEDGDLDRDDSFA